MFFLLRRKHHMGTPECVQVLPYGLPPEGQSHSYFALWMERDQPTGAIFAQAAAAEAMPCCCTA